MNPVYRTESTYFKCDGLDGLSKFIDWIIPSIKL